MRFPTLNADYMYLLQVLIGSLDYHYFLIVFIVSKDKNRYLTLKGVKNGNL